MVSRIWLRCDAHRRWQVASFGDFFAEQRQPKTLTKTSVSLPAQTSTEAESVSITREKTSSGKSVWEVTAPSTEASLTVTKEASQTTSDRPRSPSEKPVRDASSPKKRRHGVAAAAEGPIETLTYRDPFAGVYKKCVNYHIHMTSLPSVLTSDDVTLGTSSAATESTFSEA